MLSEAADKRRLCLQASRILLIISNILILLFAILLIAFGSAALTQLKELGTVYKVTIPAGIIVIGVFMLIIPILGFVGVFQNKHQVIIAYSVILFIFVIIQFGVAGGAYSMRDQVPTKIESGWASLDPEDRNNIENRFNCCGYFNYTDAPGPTCLEMSNNGTTYPDRPACGDKLVDLFDNSLYVVGTVGIVFATIELAGLILGVIVFAYLRQDGGSGVR
eukprot:TRINITY_DN3249_c0_g1_i1.p1 TRINITY_DN3249_c0_g1~~TRINITY_DN3249_c0_g1_i1.p1  ORF type:complete len:219 (+),score=81.85 TRINITY_DN3249_c0_g1_i1:93-749(+)